MKEIFLECTIGLKNVNGERTFIEGNVYTTDCKHWQDGFNTKNELGQTCEVESYFSYYFKEVKKEDEEARIEKLMCDTFGDIEKSAKQARIDEFAKAVLPSIYNYTAAHGQNFKFLSKQAYDTAEAMEAERERRINNLEYGK